MDENASDCAVEIREVKKTYAGHPSARALDGVSLKVRGNEFFTLLGPSGCGKTTLLRVIAGFESPDAGAVFLSGEDVTALPPERRPVNTVFQHYALFPHMTVAENVAFGLRRLRRPAAETRRRTDEMLELVKMADFAARRPGLLSGGQQQRVALARALAPRPKVLLLDEPLSALDLKLRQAMRLELRRLRRETGITFIFVTHDQDEALTMSDRLAVMSAGQVRQSGAPREVYERPQSHFVADFIGEANLIPARCLSLQNGTARCAWLDGEEIEAAADPHCEAGGDTFLFARPDRLRLEPAAKNAHGTVTDASYLGDRTIYEVRLRSGTLARVSAAARADDELSAGDPVRLFFSGGARALTR